MIKIHVDINAANHKKAGRTGGGGGGGGVRNPTNIQFCLVSKMSQLYIHIAGA
jgi:hypothetical protein